MLKALDLQDFQSHHDTRLEFCPGVNAIVGSSDCGKSAILRALRWVIENRGSAEAFKSYWGDSVAVTLEDDTCTVIRSRDKKENQYSLNGETFKAFGTQVPEPIGKALGFQDVNLQAQMDAPFLLSATPGEVARYLNAVMGLDKIDDSLAAIAGTARELNRRARDKSEEQAGLEQQVKALAWVDDCLQRMAKLKATAVRQEETETQLQNIRTAVSNMQAVVVPVVPDLDAYFQKINVWKTEMEQRDLDCETLRLHVSRLRALEASAVPDLDEDFVQIREQTHIIIEGELEIQALTTAAQRLKTETAFLLDTGTALKTLSEQLQAVAPRVCPTCGQEIKA